MMEEKCVFDNVVAQEPFGGSSCAATTCYHARTRFKPDYFVPYFPSSLCRK